MFKPPLLQSETKPCCCQGHDAAGASLSPWHSSSCSEQQWDRRSPWQGTDVLLEISVELAGGCVGAWQLKEQSCPLWAAKPSLARIFGLCNFPFPRAASLVGDADGLDVPRGFQSPCTTCLGAIPAPREQRGVLL